MKRLGKNHELCVGCGQCEEICSKTYFKENLKGKSCIRIENNGDEGYLIQVCSQCGVCIDICPVEALYKDKNDVIRIKKDICVGCFMCVGFCPEEAMRQHDDLLEPFKCVACGLCSKNCPTGAIFIEKIELHEIEAINETATANEI